MLVIEHEFQHVPVKLVRFHIDVCRAAPRHMTVDLKNTNVIRVRSRIRGLITPTQNCVVGMINGRQRLKAHVGATTRCIHKDRSIDSLRDRLLDG